MNGPATLTTSGATATGVAPMTTEVYPTKVCTQCGERKLLDDFHKDKRRSDGRVSECKPCHRIMVKRWKAKNHEAHNAYRAEWARQNRAANPEKSREAHRRFVEAKGSAYQSWVAMHTRCRNPNQDNWQYYGERGIKVCERWGAYDAFLSDMGERPEGMTLDRIDCDADYSPENCRWADATTQSRNQRRHRGKTWSNDD